jgi:hypothetical protein
MGYNRGKNKMITTNVMKETKMQDVNFSANCAVVVKETTNKDGMKSTTFVEFPHLKERNELQTLKCVIRGILSDEAVVSELNALFTEKDEKGNIIYRDENGKIFVPKTESGEKMQLNLPSFRRLIATFAKDSGYKVGFTDNEGRFTVKFAPEVALKSFLHIGTKNVVDFVNGNNDTKKAVVHNLAKATIEGLRQKEKVSERYEGASGADKPEKKQAAKKAAKVEAEKVEA